MKELGDFTDIDDRQLVVDAVTLAERVNTVTAQKLAHLAEIDRRGLALTLNASSITRWWARGTRVTDGNAARQLEWGQSRSSSATTDTPASSRRPHSTPNENHDRAATDSTGDERREVSDRDVGEPPNTRSCPGNLRPTTRGPRPRRQS
ncbi:hypothetical protein GCM10007304_25510 [Rhodococcoides trifolii]|uniref:Uncharacterized protein n=1 Tax=Rhodococcoides trifolii TaxID=908250 RepID=A0A917FWQ7_9NOCA|nr:hypothetical protein GCM10007304_25510 [Rhodococcus trifolii]